jgi:hypothetical protein
MSPIDRALDELYGLPPDEFMARRDALAKELKAAGDKDAAAEVKKQHKPTQAAHALNRLARDAKAELEALFEAGKVLASGKDFKASLEHQRTALEAVRKKATGPDVPAIIAVVQGALVDEKLAAAVRQGRFAKLPEAPVGFFGAAPEGAPPVVLPKREEPKRFEPARPLEVVKPLEAPKPEAPKHEAHKAHAHPHAEPRPLSVVKPIEHTKRDESLEQELKAAEKEATALADEVSELERELLDTRRRAHQAAEKVAKLKKRLDA